MKKLLHTMPQKGRVEWIGLRPKKRQDLETVQHAEVNEDGLIGDHYKGQSKKRQVTLIQAEHLQTIAAILGKKTIDPLDTRRNIVVSGINLLALNNCTFKIGEVVLKTTGYCHPCSRMEENLGTGGYNAMRGHGGLTTQVVSGGTIKIGDEVSLLEVLENQQEA